MERGWFPVDFEELMMLAQPSALRIVLHSPRRIATYAFQLKNRGRGRGSFSSDQPRTLPDFESPNFTIKNDFSLESNLTDRLTLKRIRDGVSRRSSHERDTLVASRTWHNNSFQLSEFFFNRQRRGNVVKYSFKAYLIFVLNDRHRSSTSSSTALFNRPMNFIAINQRPTIGQRISVCR